MGDYQDSDYSKRAQDDYERARQEADSAGKSYDGNQAWKQAQDDMFHAQQKVEWERRDWERQEWEARNRTARELDGHQGSSAPPGLGSAIDRAGPSVPGSTVPSGGKVSFAIADSLATSVAGMTRTHPGLFRFIFRGIARLMCWPIPYIQRALDRAGIRNSFVRFIAILFGWMGYLLLLDLCILGLSKS
jgi:hypothetical protein